MKHWQADNNTANTALYSEVMIENQDVKALLDHIRAHKYEAFDAAMKTFPMTAPLWLH